MFGPNHLLLAAASLAAGLLLVVASARSQPSDTGQPSIRRVDNNTIVVRGEPEGLKSLNLNLDPSILLNSADPNAMVLHGTAPMIRNMLHILRGEAVPRTFNGRRVSRGDLPWQVAFIDAATTDPVTGLFCGGVLIGDRWVLTAAHCMVNSRASHGTPSPARFYMIFGEVSLTQPAQPVRARHIWVHEPWDAMTQRFDRDIALIELELPAVGGIARPIALPPPDDTLMLATGADILVAGWGYTEANRNSPDLLRTNVNVYDHRVCSNKPMYRPHVTNNMFCAAAPGADTCANDSGGPAISTAGAIPTLVGLTSFGSQQCADPNYPGVYVRISPYLQWIRERMRS